MAVTWLKHTGSLLFQSSYFKIGKETTLVKSFLGVFKLLIITIHLFWWLCVMRMVSVPIADTLTRWLPFQTNPRSVWPDKKLNGSAISHWFSAFHMRKGAEHKEWQPERSCASICLFCFTVHGLLQVKGYIIPLSVHALQPIALHALFFPVQLFDVSRWFGCYLTSEEKRY